jgi:hypothetical protein
MALRVGLASHVATGESEVVFWCISRGCGGRVEEMGWDVVNA